eukprot:GHVU01166056.1.p1 GENE.GHVU01166056.1~~GHVU01166056.1.p1  ORF type:complete len:932 (-),score=193.12 GHVU01166056.1:163-2958(-)
MAYPERHAFGLQLQNFMKSIPSLHELSPLSRTAFLSIPKSTSLMVYAKPGVELKVKYPNTHATTYSPKGSNDYGKVGGFVAICAAQAVDICKINEQEYDGKRIEYAMALGAYTTIATTDSFSGYPIITALFMNPQLVADAIEQQIDHPRLRIQESEGFKLSVSYDFLTATNSHFVDKAAKMMAESVARTSNIYRAMMISLGTKTALHTDEAFTDQIPKEFKHRIERVNVTMSVRAAMATISIGLSKGCAATASNLLKRNKNDFNAYLASYNGLYVPMDIRRMKCSREAIAIYYICRSKDIHTAIHDCTGKSPLTAACIVKKLNQLAGTEEGNTMSQNDKIVLWSLRTMNEFDHNIIASLLMHLTNNQRTVTVSANSFSTWNDVRGLGGPEMDSAEWRKNAIDYLHGIPKFNMHYGFFHIRVIKSEMAIRDLNREREELFSFCTMNNEFKFFKQAEEQAQIDFEEVNGVFPELEEEGSDSDDDNGEDSQIDPDKWPGRGIICKNDNDEVSARIESDLVDDAGFAGDEEIKTILKSIEAVGPKKDELHELGRKAVIAVCKSIDVSPQRRWRVKKPNVDDDDDGGELAYSKEDVVDASYNEDNVKEVNDMNGKEFMNPTFRSPFYSFSQLSDITGVCPEILRDYPKERLGLMKFHIRGRLNNLAEKSIGMPAWNECTRSQKKESIRQQLILKYKLQWIKEKSCRPRCAMTFAMGAALRHIKRFADEDSYNFSALKHMFALSIINEDYHTASVKMTRVYNYLKVVEYFTLQEIVKFLQEEIMWTFTDIDEMNTAIVKTSFSEAVRNVANQFIKPRRVYPPKLLKIAAFSMTEFVPGKSYVRCRGDGDESEVGSEDEALFAIPDMQKDGRSLKENIKCSLVKSFDPEFAFDSFYDELIDKSDPSVIEILWNSHVEKIKMQNNIDPTDNINNEDFAE